MTAGARGLTLARPVFLVAAFIALLLGSCHATAAQAPAPAITDDELIKRRVIGKWITDFVEGSATLEIVTVVGTSFFGTYEITHGTKGIRETYPLKGRVIGKIVTFTVTSESGQPAEYRLTIDGNTMKGGPFGTERVYTRQSSLFDKYEKLVPEGKTEALLEEENKSDPAWPVVKNAQWCVPLGTPIPANAVVVSVRWHGVDLECLPGAMTASHAAAAGSQEVTGPIRNLELVRDQSTGVEILVVWGEPGTAFCIYDLSEVRFVAPANGATPTYRFTRGEPAVILTIDPAEFNRLKPVTLPDVPCS